MAEICCGVVSETDASQSSEPRSRTARRRRMEIRRFRFVAGESATGTEDVTQKRQRPGINQASLSRDTENAVENCDDGSTEVLQTNIERSGTDNISFTRPSGIPSILAQVEYSSCEDSEALKAYPKFGVASVCGRRREMEDAVAIYPSYFRTGSETSTELHYFAVYDGHGCSHVAKKCKDRLHELVKEELQSDEAPTEWKETMERSFSRMDKEAIACKDGVFSENCKCELQTQECDAVGSTAVVAVVTTDKVIIANCGDSRAVLCRGGKAIPLSSDHKPDRPDELNRIEEAGGRVIYWDGPRVLGVLAMSRAIGDNYLKPYVSSEPEVTVTDRTEEDDFLILASDGLWDVVSNDTACGVARMCLRGKVPKTKVTVDGELTAVTGSENADKACSNASMLLTKLALARHSADNVSVVVINLKKSRI